MDEKKNSFKILEKSYMEKFIKSSDDVELNIKNTTGKMEMISNITEVFIPKFFNAITYMFEVLGETNNLKK